MISTYANILISFLNATQLSTVRNHTVGELNEIKHNLKTDFEEIFGADAFQKYYLGKEKTPKYEDYTYVEENGITHIHAMDPKLKSTPVKTHVLHEAFADQLGINFATQTYGVLHITKFQPYFMAAAMHQYTKLDIYDELAGKLYDELEIAIRANIKRDEDFLPMNEWGLRTIIDDISLAISTMVEHTRPQSLQLSDMIDPMDKSANPGPRQMIE